MCQNSQYVKEKGFIVCIFKKLDLITKHIYILIDF